MQVGALSVRQPWADLIVGGRKDVENRSWTTRHRGLLAIHAAGKIDLAGCREYGIDPGELVTSAIVGTVELIDIVRNSKSRWADEDAFHWLLSEARRLKRPIPYSGALRLWLAKTKQTLGA